MAIDIGHTLNWRFQGFLSCCWFTCIEMVMEHKHGKVQGKKEKHSQLALDAVKRNTGSHIGIHADYYDLKSNNKLADNTNIHDWKEALRRGPVIAEGKYGWSRMGLGQHVIVIAGVSNTGRLLSPAA